MTDKEFRDTKRRCMEVLGWWDAPLGLGEWHLNISFHREAFEQNTFDGYRTQAACTSSWQYREAQIDIDVSACCGMDDDELERLLLHETGHILCSVLRGVDVEADRQAPPSEEYLCSTIAIALQRARQKGAALTPTRNRAKA